METISKTVADFKSRTDKMRGELIALIHAAVLRNNGCIGTFYRNLGRHHIEDLTEEEYSDSPIVFIHNSAFYTYGGYEAATLYDLFLHSKDGKLMVTLNGEAGEDFDESIESVQIEGLLCIVSWLFEKKFINEESTAPWRCDACGSLNIEQKCWIDPNTGEINTQDSVSDDECLCHDCNNCTGHTQEIINP